MKRIMIMAFMALSVCLKAQDWWHVGPHSSNNTGGNTFNSGRAECLAVNTAHGDSVYAGSRGGVWVTANANLGTGAKWSLLDPNNYMRYGGVSCIAYGPTTHHIYVGSSDMDELASNPYIYIYDNASSTWSTYPYALPTGCYIDNIVFYPGKDSIVYACTTQGLYLSTNNGPWSLVSPGSTEIKNLVIFMDGTTTYYVACGLGTFITSTTGNSFTANSAIQTTMSTNGGYGTWTRIGSNICLGDLSGSIKDMYLLTQVSNANYSGLYVYQVTENGGTISTSGNLGSMQEYGDGNGYRRLQLGYAPSNGLLFFGSVYAYYIDTKNALSNINSLPNVYPGSAYDHTDQHAAVDDPSINTIFRATDGGITVYNYNGYTFSGSSCSSNCPAFNFANDSFDVCQINGFSGAGPDTSVYISGEQDIIPGVVYDFSNPSAPVKNPNAGTWENNGGIIDQFTGQTMITNSSSYSSSWDYSTNGGTSFTRTTSAYQAAFEPTFEGSCKRPDGNYPQFGRNNLAEDPSRPGVYYLGTNEIDQWEPDSGTCTPMAFAVKYRTNGWYSHVTGVTCADTMNQNYVEYSATTSSIGICPFNKNGFYFTVAPVDGFWFGAPRSASQVFKFVGTDIDNVWEGNNESTAFTAITPNINAVEGLSLTCDQIMYNVNYPNVVVSPWDPQLAWVSCYTSDAPAVRVLAYDGHTGTWSDYSTGLPTGAPPTGEIPYSMVLENGSNNGIYLGTDKGVYYRNATMSSWVSYSTDLPGVRSNQLEINYYENRLRSGTFGRGIWESALNCPINFSFVANNSTNSEFDEVTQYISSTATITPSTTLPNGEASFVNYRAGTYVSLNPGFRAEYQSNFFAYIHPCDASGGSQMHRPRRGDSKPLVEEEKEKPAPSLLVYPNPNGGKFTIGLAGDEVNDVYVYDIAGNLVYHNSQMKGISELNLENQATGMYFIRVISADGQVLSKKVIISR